MRGWSDSRLAQPTSAQIREERRLEREEGKRAKIEGREEMRLESMKRDPSVPRISVVVPSEISLEDIRESQAELEGDEGPYEPSSVEVLVVPENAESEWSVTGEGEEAAPAPPAGESDESAGPAAEPAVPAEAPATESSDAATEAAPAATGDIYAPVPMSR
ncbi:MAG: hypothetical protein BWY59_00820 [Verrucomicrobia bacterium ADurb.Bin345]|nr:MAG: hypothetical protein BWY59_00820 [Verrucomicrobia bacterium ADurb.Bin345]